MRTLILLAGLTPVLVTGCYSQSKTNHAEPASVRDEPKRMTRDEFEEAIKPLRTAREFVARFGTPSETDQLQTFFLMTFDNLTRDTITNKNDRWLMVFFDGTGMDATYHHHAFTP